MLQRIFQESWKYGVLDVNVLLPHHTNSHWSLKTYLPFQNDCFALKIQHISTFTHLNYTNELNITFDQLYASKNRNFNKCPITVATYHAQPFVSITKDGRNASRFDGIEVTLIEHIATAINLTIIYNNIGEKGDVLDNGTVTGSIKEVSVFCKSRNKSIVMNSPILKVETMFVIMNSSHFVSIH